MNGDWEAPPQTPPHKGKGLNLPRPITVAIARDVGLEQAVSPG